MNRDIPTDGRNRHPALEASFEIELVKEGGGWR